MTMMTPSYRYTFAADIPLMEVQETLLLALLAGEALHGAAQRQLDAAYRLDLPGRACVIAADTPFGRNFNKLFTNFLRCEFGANAFRVERITARDVPEPQGAK
jgi:hypothetical protein